MGHRLIGPLSEPPCAREWIELCFERPVPGFVPSEANLRVSLDLPDQAYQRAQVWKETVKTDLSARQADWSKPTACTLWTVRDILAHQAGGYTRGTGYREVNGSPFTRCGEMGPERRQPSRLSLSF